MISSVGWYYPVIEQRFHRFRRGFAMSMSCGRFMGTFVLAGSFLSIVFLSTQTGVSQPQKGQPLEQRGKLLFDRLDRNQDGKLTPDEIPARGKGLFKQIDSDGDGVVTLEEHLQFHKKRFAQQPRRGRQRGPQVPEGTEVFRDIEYIKGGHERQKLDVYVPAEAKEKMPLVVWIHGGGWRNGDKRRCPALYLLDKGYVVASVNYRLSQDAIFPAQIQDCKAAIRYLKSHASRFHIDPTKVGAWGSSAGGHLVALLGTSGDVAEFEHPQAPQTELTSRVQAVCDYYGPTDFAKMSQQTTIEGPFDHDSADSPESKLIGGAIQENIKKANAASPITYVSKDDPPFLIVHGDSDPLVPVDQSKTFQQKLEETGVDSELVIVKGGGHGPFKSREMLEKVKHFFDRHLKN